jgi:hypothetical protein|tara:strand:+ start:419 stop:589 length:171 start_codon:yes stop_codon:yes gene_type:complete
MKGLTHDDIRDIAIKIVDDMVDSCLITNCLDTDDTTEFDVQDIIVKRLEENLYIKS